MTAALTAAGCPVAMSGSSLCGPPRSRSSSGRDSEGDAPGLDYLDARKLCCPPPPPRLFFPLATVAGKGKSAIFQGSSMPQEVPWTRVIPRSG